MAGKDARGTPPALLLVGSGAVSVQLGAALATKLFGRVGPAGAVTLRLVIAAVLLCMLTAVLGRRPGRARALRRERRDRLVAVAFGLALAGMNLSFYEAIDRIPLGVAVTVEFAGPLLLALSTSRRWVDATWAVLAGAGVALLATAPGGRLDPVGLVLAGLAGIGWVCYILLARETGRRYPTLPGLTVAMVAGSLAMLPVGLAGGGSRLLQPGVLGLGAAVAVLSSVLPYSLELVALTRVTARSFGVMLSLDPAVATVAGLLVLGQHLTLREWAAICLVVAANLGNAVAGRPEVVAAAPP